MKRTITVAAYRRPQYLQLVLAALAEAFGNCLEYSADVIIGVDPGALEQPEVEAVARSFHAAETIVWPEHLGVNEHPRRLLQYAFNELESDFNLHLEDDTVPSPDALRLALWYEDRRQPASLSLSLHNPSSDYEHPERVYRTARFGAWGWVCHRHAWEDYVVLWWNFKRDFPIGWDWSISEIMKREALYSLAPSLSRVHNIGRESGRYQTPEGYDRDFAGQVWAGVEHMQRVEDFKL